MSEQAPQLPEALNQYSALEAQVTANGANRVYGVDEQGKKTALKGDNVLEAYGYGSVEEEESRLSNRDIYEEYSDAVKSGEASKDETFRDWVKRGSTKDAAKWYTATRAHGEAPDVAIGDQNGEYRDANNHAIDVDDLFNGSRTTEDEDTRLDNRDHTEALNAREGKENPTDDDVAYYRWLKNNSGPAEKQEVTEEETPGSKGNTPATPDDPSTPDGRNGSDDDEKGGATKDDDETSKVTKRVFDITTDPKEARKYWEENHEKDNLGPWQTYLLGGHNSWGIRRDVEVEPPVVEPPVVEPPVVEPPVVEPPTAPTPVVVPPRTPETPDRVRQPGKLRKWLGRGALALLTLAGGYTAGRLHENYIVKSHDTPSVDTINKFEDDTRRAPEADQEHMVRNFDLSQQFLDSKTGIATEKGKANFENMQDAVEKKAQELKVKHGDSLSDKRAHELAEQWVKADMARKAAENAEANS